MNFTKIKNKSDKLVSVAIYAFILVSLIGCNDTGNVQQLPQRKYQLVWSDEFDSVAGASPDATKWSFDLGGGGWGNNEYEVYTNSPATASTDGNGTLAIKTSLPKWVTDHWENIYSARINTKGKFEQAYGRFEARIKTPYGSGMWPAFWLLGANKDTIGWPQCGEIDIMELNGSKSSIINGSLHGPGYSHGAAITKSFALANARYNADFHVFAIEWGKDYIDYFVDNVLYQEITPTNVLGKGDWVFNDHPFYILLNIAVGGDYVTSPTQQTPFPQTMLVDYVRVYKEVK